jgi:hypothetical protein
MFIATLSLVTSIYNGYLNGKFVDFIQRNAGRTEYLRTCKENHRCVFSDQGEDRRVNGAGAQAAIGAGRGGHAVAKVRRARHLSRQSAGRADPRTLHQLTTI